MMPATGTTSKLMEVHGGHRWPVPAGRPGLRRRPEHAVIGGSATVTLVVA
jgi:hypothetical protein